MGDLLGQQLAQPPQDGISNLRFATTGDLLLASSWDGVSHLSLGACACRARYYGCTVIVACCHHVHCWPCL